MSKAQIRQLSQEELFTLSLQRGSHNRYTKEALYAQELIYYANRYYPHEIINEPNPFDYEPFSSVTNVELNTTSFSPFEKTNRSKSK